MTLQELVQSIHIGFPPAMGLEYLPPSWRDWLDLEVVRVQLAFYYRKRRTLLILYVIPGTTMTVWVGSQKWIVGASASLCVDDTLLKSVICEAWKTKSGAWPTADFNVAVDRMISRIPRFPIRPVTLATESDDSELLTSEIELL